MFKLVRFTAKGFYCIFPVILMFISPLSSVEEDGESWGVNIGSGSGTEAASAEDSAEDMLNLGAEGKSAAS